MTQDNAMEPKHNIDPKTASDLVIIFSNISSLMWEHRYDEATKLLKQHTRKFNEIACTPHKELTDEEYMKGLEASRLRQAALINKTLIAHFRA